MYVYVVFYAPVFVFPEDKTIDAVHCVYKEERDAKTFINAKGEDYYYESHEVI